MSITWQRIHAFRMTSRDIERLARFYVDALGCVAGPRESISDDEIELLGLSGSGQRIPLRLGRERLDLDAFDPPGRSFPHATTAADLVFQHVAIATSDAAAAWQRLHACGAIPLSREPPVTLPPSSGGITAVKFRDPEGHPLELLQFPSGAAPQWRGHGVLGIDHSALCVGDLDSARQFFLARGLSVSAHSLNVGPEQSELDDLDPVQVDVISLEPATRRPHLELLSYRVPRSRASPRLAADDTVATRTVWQADTDALVRDPAGHLHLLQRRLD